MSPVWMVVLGVFTAVLFVTLLTVIHNKKQRWAHWRILPPLLAFGPLGPPGVLILVALEEGLVGFLSAAGSGLLLLAGLTLCLVVWFSAVAGYWVLWLVRR